ncbi:MAG: dipeptidase PepE [Bacteroidales bacterium]
MRLLLISNSTNAGEEYLEYPVPEIRKFLGEKTLNCAFIPYAGVSISYDDYTQRVRHRFEEAGHNIVSVHEVDDPSKLVGESDCTVVGGGNTWQLLKLIQEQGLIEAVQNEVLKGKPYIGWSAGSNMACPTIRTTNDMPIIQPRDFNAFNFIPFQINPHYLDANPEGHAGETREARIEEFIELNRDIYVLGLREGTMLRIEEQTIELIGQRNARLFRYGEKPRELSKEQDLNFLLDL